VAILGHTHTYWTFGRRRTVAGNGGGGPKGQWRGKARGVTYQKRSGAYQKGGVANRKVGVSKERGGA